MIRFLLLLSLFSPFAALSHAYVPAKTQHQALLLKGADLYTVTQGILKETDLLIEQGKITQIGSNLTIPGVQVIDYSGQQIYPSLIAMNTQLGLTEVNAVRSTNDYEEVSAFNSNVIAHVAYNADSEQIPTIRSNGIGYIQLTPQGSLLQGQSSVLQLDAWNWQQALIQPQEGMHLAWPVFSNKKPYEPLKQIQRAFEESLRYQAAFNENMHQGIDNRWQALLPTVNQQQTLYLHANHAQAIESALLFAAQQNLNPVLVGAKDAAHVLPLLQRYKTPVIYSSPFGLPHHDDDRVHSAYRTPAQLHKAGIDFAIALEGSWSIRNLPFAAGMAIGYGLPPAAALRSVTLTPAKLLGIDDRLGSLEVGKLASLVVSKGDIFDFSGHQVTALYLSGRSINLDNRHKQLYRKYSQQ